MNKHATERREPMNVSRPAPSWNFGKAAAGNTLEQIKKTERNVAVAEMDLPACVFVSQAMFLAVFHGRACATSDSIGRHMTL
jgi:hypothetical protein